MEFILSLRISGYTPAMSLEVPLSQIFGVEIKRVAKCSPIQVEIARRTVHPQRFHEERKDALNVICGLLVAAQIPVNDPFDMYAKPNHLK